MINNLSNRAYAWLMGGLVASIISLALLIQHAKDIASALQWIGLLLLALVVLGILWLLYLLYHNFQVQRFTRKKMKAEVELLSTEKWERQQTLLLEQKRIDLEMEKIKAEMELNKWRVLVPSGHTVVFPDEDYHAIASHAPAQIARIGKGEVVDADPVKKIQIPESYDLIDVFRKMDVAKDHIFLCKTEDGILTVNAHKQLCHGVFNAITGRGKTVVERGIEMQLLKAGHEVIHADIKFTLIDEEGLDYRPIAKALLDQGPIAGCDLPHLLMETEQIKQMVEWAALTEVPRRLKLYHAGIHTYETLYIFLEEFLYLVKLYPEIAEWVETLIIVGRSLGIKIFTVAQNFLARDTKLSGAMRENFETAYYLGGDDHSGAVILDMSKKDLMQFLNTNNLVLGKGLAMMRNNTVAPQARLVRTGWASNDALYYLMGRADNFKLPGTPSGLYAGAELMRDEGLSWQSPTQTTLVVEPSSSDRNTGPLRGMPNDDENGLVEPLGTGPNSSPNDLALGDDDLMMNDLQIQQFEILYKALGNIKECLRRVDGCNNRHHRHASWIVRSKQLRRS